MVNSRVIVIVAIFSTTLGLIFGAQMAKAADDPNVNAQQGPITVTNQDNDDSHNGKQIKPTADPNYYYNRCNNILSEYVNNKGMVNYYKLRRMRIHLFTVLNSFQNLDTVDYNSWTNDQKVAFWINVYNMQMLSIIVDNYPVESGRLNRLWWPPSSIRHIPPSNLVGSEKWNNYKFYVMTEVFTLSEIETRFFVDEFNMPLALLAVTQASMDSPPLRNRAYTGTDLEDQLNSQAERLFENKRAFRVDRGKNQVYISALFQQSWYGPLFVKKYGTDSRFKDHGPVQRAVLNLISNFEDQNIVNYLETGTYKIEHISYDWRLNDQ